MKLIVGLGNPGAEYEGTRHNIGFRVVEAFAARYRIAVDRHEKNAMVGKGRVAGNAVVVAKPLTFMNVSGSAVSLLVRANLEAPSDLLVVYDDVDLPLGKIRIREGGSPGTHNGMKSIVDALGTDRFPRLRFGIRGEDFDGRRDLADFVLDRFEEDEQEQVVAGVTRAVEAVFLFARDDLRRAMNQFNRDPVPVEPETT
ncbi:MAG TPA: aminoacyl-tRNA hydrolase [Thermoanaerobaculia bacterium]|nr:aminoacyl-tRNA hydrolase [Thermoanaerobaculia bacterium]